MEFTDKYISSQENIEKPDAKKTCISNDAYAIGEIIQELLKEIKTVQEILRVK